jgi:hypothetical protein
MVTDDFIAVRRLEVAGEPEREVAVAIKKPTPDGDNFRCEFQILGLGNDKVRYSMGVDAIQALDLAMKHAGVCLYTSPEGKRGVLRWLGGRDLGMPLTDNVIDLIPRE